MRFFYSIKCSTEILASIFKDGFENVRITNGLPVDCKFVESIDLGNGSVKLLFEPIKKSLDKDIELFPVVSVER